MSEPEPAPDGFLVPPLEKWFNDHYEGAMASFAEQAQAYAAGSVGRDPSGGPQDDPVKSLMSGFTASRAHMPPPAFRDLQMRNAEANADAALSARKLTAYTEVPDELLMDSGLIPDTRPPMPPLPWRTRLRYKLSDWRGRIARRAYRIIAGYWPDNGEDDW